MEQIDIILIIICAALLVLSFVMNILASSRLSRLSEAISQVELKIESASTNSQPGRDVTRGLPESTSLLNVSATDSSITDSKVGRYRPPNTTALEIGSVNKPSRPAVSKAGIKIDDSAINNQITPAESSGDEDVMDVVVATDAFITTKPPKSEDVESLEINPFIAKEQRIDFDIIKKTLTSVKNNETAVIDMVDIPMMIESEVASFKAILKPYLSQKRGIRLKNASEEIKTALITDFPELLFS